MKVDRSSVTRILVITLSNLGDVVLTTPVVNALAREFPDARIDIMVGPKGKEVFEADPRIAKVIVYDKHVPLIEKRRLSVKLKKLNYDLIADLRNTIFPLLLGARYRTSTIQKFPPHIVHKRDCHLYRLSSFGIDGTQTPSSIVLTKEDEGFVELMLRFSHIEKPFVVVNPGAKSHLKRWMEEGFTAVCNRLIDECRVSVVVTGAGEDSEVADRIIAGIKGKINNFVNRTSTRQLAALLKRSALLITNDSAPLHIACAVNTKTLALFGPTDLLKYGPTGETDVVICKKLHCSPCEKASCQYNHECMRLISPDEVFQAARELLQGYEIT